MVVMVMPLVPLLPALDDANDNASHTHTQDEAMAMAQCPMAQFGGWCPCVLSPVSQVSMMDVAAAVGWG